MPRLTTFGVEAEFQIGAADVIQRLNEDGWAGDNRLHGYHCDCEFCDFGNGYPFRGQTDSSCSGEIITDVFGVDPLNGQPFGGSTYDHVEMFRLLSNAAVDVDAEPGVNSGLHVHVGIGGLDYFDLCRSLWQIARWEPVLTRIAGGRWSDQREGMNTTLRNVLLPNTRRLAPDGEVNAEFWRNYTPEDCYLDDMLNRSQCSDRHSNLNTGANRAPTWEFRLWNSTRSAWRMEMFSGLSIALMDPEVTAGLAELETPLRRRSPSSGIDNVALACDNAGHSRTAELVSRQAAYLDNRAESAPATLTSL